MGGPVSLPSSGLGRFAGGGGLPDWNKFSSGDFTLVNDFYAVGGTFTIDSNSQFSMSYSRSVGGAWWSRSRMYRGPAVGDFDADLTRTGSGLILEVRKQIVSITGLDGTVEPYFMSNVGENGGSLNGADLLANRGRGSGIRYVADAVSSADMRVINHQNQDINQIGADATYGEDIALGGVVTVLSSWWFDTSTSGNCRTTAYDGSGNMVVKKSGVGFGTAAPTHFCFGYGNNVLGTAGTVTQDVIVEWRVYDPRDY